MTFTTNGLKRGAALLLCASLLLPLFPSAAVAQKRVVIIKADQPNLWTLEQAHYLLAQMHRRNLDLKAKKLEELDPNEIAGLRFDVMRMLVEFGATFNQADLESNRLFSANRTFNSSRRQELLTERDRLRQDSLDLAGEVEELQTEKAGTSDKDEQARLDARIAAKNTRLARVDKEIEQLNAELGTLPAPSGTPTATTGGATFEPGKLPQSTFDEAFKSAAAQQIQKFNQEPQLNATLRLDNFLQMQYEIISKQLSLLRDELGPGERLVFLELPQTVNASHHESNRKWAQSWWKIAGYTRREREPGPAAPVPNPPPPVRSNQQPVTIVQDYKSILGNEGIDLPLAAPAPCVTHTPIHFANTKAFRVTDDPAKPKLTPSGIPVKDLQGRVRNVTVTLNVLRHPNPADLDLLLVGPQGQNALILSDVANPAIAGGVSLRLEDGAAAVPNAGALSPPPNLYAPTNQPGDADTFPEPKSLGGSSLSVFDGTDPNGMWNLYAVDDSGAVEGSIDGGWSLDITTDCPPPPAGQQVTYKDKYVDLDEFAGQPDGLGANSILKNKLANAKFENRMVRTVELIPRQGSLNVNDMNLKVKAGAFNFVLSTLFGFGARLNVQRQREQFSQFVQQELYSAGFGKGAREFGWTFMPMPGTDRLMSGIRTTYAVVVVPQEATSLVLESNGCYFPRSSYQPNNFADTKASPEWNKDDRRSRNCNGTISQAFVVPIPSANINGTNDFWVENISFQPVTKGKRIVVSISGQNFSPQMGVLVNGLPLVQSIGLAQPLIRDDSEAGRLTRDEFKDAEVTGSVERVDSNRIIFSFKMPTDFSGTPTITLMAPGRAVDINWIPHVNINEAQDTSLDAYPKKMFGQGPGPEPFRIDRVRVFRTSDPRVLKAAVSGAGLSDVAKVFVNGVTPTDSKVESAGLLTLTFVTPQDDTIKVTLVSKDDDPKKVLTVESDAVANPVFLSISDVEVTTYEADAEDEPATLLVKIKGTGFTDALKWFIEGKTSPLPVAVKSATEAVFTMPDPRAAAVVTLEDDKGQRARIVVTRKTRRQ
jgi:subtilisin-like proprotein convertase family protein